MILMYFCKRMGLKLREIAPPTDESKSGYSKEGRAARGLEGNFSGKKACSSGEV